MYLSLEVVLALYIITQFYFFSNPQEITKKERVLYWIYIQSLYKKFKKCLAEGRDKQAHRQGLAMIRSLILSLSSDSPFQRFVRTVVPAR